MKKLIIILLAAVSLSSCSNFYRVVVAKGPATSTSIDDLKKQQKYFILRDTSRAYAMNNISISPDGQSLQTDLTSIPDQHMTYLWKPRGEKPKYDKMNEPYVLSEVHLYMLPDSNMAPGHYILPIKNIQATEILEEDKKRTRQNHTRVIILSVAGSAVTIAAIVGIAAATAFINIL